MPMLPSIYTRNLNTTLASRAEGVTSGGHGVDDRVPDTTIPVKGQTGSVWN